MKKVIELEDRGFVVVDKISAANINFENDKQVRIFCEGIDNGYYINCPDAETARKLYNKVLNAVKNEDTE